MNHDRIPILPDREPSIVGWARLGDGPTAVYVDPRRVDAIKPVGDSCDVCTAGAHVVRVANWSADRVAAELLTGLCPELTVVRPPAPVPTPAATQSPGSVAELAPGQVWEDSYGSARVEIYHIDRQPHPKHGSAINYKLVSSPNVTGSRYPDSFRKAFPNLISPGLASPEPATPPNPPPSPVALLAAGRRCRFVRDAGSLSEDFAGTIYAEVRSDFNRNFTRIVQDEDEPAYLGIVLPESRSDPYYDGRAVTEFGIKQIDAARDLNGFLARLGYRFAGTVQGSNAR